MMNRKRILSLVLALILIVSLLAGCGQPKDGGAATSTSKDTLNVIVGSDVSQFNPHVTNTFTDIMAIYQIYERLVYYIDGEVVPGLAESWTVSDDNKTMVFTLREGAKFHNGQECTSEDVVYSLERNLERPNAASSRALYESITAIDPSTVEIKLTVGLESIFSSLSSPGMSIVCKSYVEEKGDDAFLEPVGTGAYKLTEWKKGSSIKMEAFEDYGEPVPIKYLNFNIVADTSNALISLETGEADFIISMPESNYPLVKDNPDLVLQTAPSHSSTTLVLNIRNGVLSNENLRKAIAYGIDREAIRTAAYEGTGTLATGSFPDFLYYSGTDYGFEYDVEKAKEYMAASGVEPGVEITIKTSDVYGDVVPQMIQNNLAEIGITIKIESLEMSAHSMDYLNGDFEIIYAGGSTIWPDQAYNLYNSYYWPDSTWSFSSPDDDRFNAQLEAMRQEIDPEKKTAMVDEMMSQLHELCNEIPLITKDANIVYRNGLKNTYVDPNGMFYCFKDFSW